MSDSDRSHASSQSDDKPTTTLRPGAVVGPWRVEYELGRGGMGIVFAVIHEAIGKRAAMKVIHQHLCTPGSPERFLLEARAVNAATHPNIVDIFESGALEDGRPYLIMERLSGRTLGDRLADGRIPPVEVIDYLLPLCDALAAAHQAGVVHRDIKLDNVFLVDRPTGTTMFGPQVKLLDWGIASLASADDRAFRDMLVGTPRYVAPEQARGEPPTPASDVYSLGVVAYELFLEAPPFAADSAAEILAMHLAEPPPPPRDVWPQIPPSLELLLLDMLAKAPELRPKIGRVAEILGEIRGELVRRRPHSQPPVEVTGPTRALIEHGPTLLSDPVGSRRRWIYAAAGTAALGLAIAGRLVLTSQSTAAASELPERPADPVAAPQVVPVATAPPVMTAPAPAPRTAKQPAPAAPSPPLPRRAAVRTPRPVVTAPMVPAEPVQVRAARDASSLVPTPRPTRPRLHPDGTVDPY